MALIHIRRENGIYDYVDESELIRKDITVDNENECTKVIEYRFPNSDVIVHRSAHVTLKKVPAMMGSIGGF